MGDERTYIYVHDHPATTDILGDLCRMGAYYRGNECYSCPNEVVRDEIAEYLFAKSIRFSYSDKGVELPILTEKEARYLARGNAFRRVL